MATTYRLTYKYTGQENTSATRSVALSKFTLSGDTDKPMGKITSITYIHYHTSTKTQSWGLRGRLTFSDGTNIVSDNVYEEISGNVVKFTNTFTTLPTPEQFKLVQNIETLDTQGKTTVGGYDGDLYWRANSSYPMYLYVDFEAGGGAIWDENGGQKSMTSYIWKTSNPTTYYYPEAAMTDYNSQGCTVSASSENNTDHRAWRAFNKTNDPNPWAAAAYSSDPTPWLQLTYPKALYNIKVHISNRTDNYVRGPIDGVIYGSNDGGSTLTQIGSFSGQDPNPGKYFSVQCNNSGTAYNTVRILSTSHGNGSSPCNIAEMRVEGTDIGTNGGWAEANPVIWKTSNPITYTYPEAGMTEHVSQGCIASASTELNQSYPAWKAFNKATGSGDIWFAGDTPTPHWLQLVMPRPLYNISVQLTNRFANDHKGAIDGIIYGSNDNGATLTQIGSFSGRSPNYGVTTTITCDNSTIAYNTVRLYITRWGDVNGNPTTSLGMGVGAMLVSGTDIGTNGGWANLDGDKYHKVLCYPKQGMTANLSQDCIAAASTQYNANYAPFHAFDKSTSAVWCSTTADTSPWLQIELPEPLFNISLVLINRVHANYTPGAFIDFSVNGSNDGNSFTKIYEATGRNGSTSGASSGHTIGNKTAYRILKFIPTNWAGKGSNYCGMGHIYIFGTKKP